MALKTEVTKELKVDGGDHSFEANEDLSSSKQFLAVTFTSGVTSGQPKVGLPSGQGVLPAGILLNEPASGELAEVRDQGIAIMVAVGAFNSGIELAIDGASGKVSAAGAADYVIGISQEAALEANHEVRVRMAGFYQKN